MTWHIDIWQAYLGQEVGHGVADDGTGGGDVPEPRAVPAQLEIVSKF
jgi:hypothetical protein